MIVMCTRSYRWSVPVISWLMTIMYVTYHFHNFRSNPLDYQIRVGSSFNDNGGEIYSVREYIRHPGFNYMGMDNDVAILYLMTPMKFSKEIAPIDMMEKHEEIKDGEHTIITGWGNTRVSWFYHTGISMLILELSFEF